MLMRRLNQRSATGLGRRQAGDTIVEVMIAIAIVSFVLVAAYVTANKNTLINQDTQERGQALQLVTTQLEFLRNNHGISASNNCFDASGTPKAAIVGPTNPCLVSGDGTQDASGVQPAYTIAIAQPGGGSTTYKVQVTWASLLSGHTNDNVTMYYQP